MTWWQYLILANVYLLLFYGFYALMLRKETFFQMNRLYLVSTAVLSFLIPLMQSDWARGLFITQQIKKTIYHLDPVMVYQLPPVQERHFTLGNALAIVYISGIVLLALRFAIQLILLRRSLKHEHTDDAYSFFKTIKLSEKIMGHSVIMEHEQVHARQWHSADVLLIEAIMITNWFNPAVYLYRRGIKHIHEFIADRNAIKCGTSKQEYALLLLSETFKTPAHQLVNPFFNHSLLKLRILMLQRNNSHRTALLKYGLSAPLFALMLVLSSATTRTNHVINIINKKAEQVLEIPASAESITRATDAITTITNRPVSRQPSLPPAVQEFIPAAKPVPQPATVKKDSLLIFHTAEKLPAFPGGLGAFSKFLAQNLKLVNDADKRVVLSFIVETDGSLSNIRGVHGDENEVSDAIKVLAACPKWEPAEQNGNKIRMQMVTPLMFRMAQGGPRTAVITTDSGANHRMITMTQRFDGSPLPPLRITDTAKITRVFIRRHPEPATTYTYSYSNNGIPANTLLMIDGEVVSSADFRKLNPSGIEKISVFKGDDAVKRYGDKAKDKDGVVDVQTKDHQ